MFPFRTVLNVMIYCMGIRTVQVIKLISKDSIEDCMLQLGQKKLKLEQDMTAAEQGKETCTRTYRFLTAYTLSL